MSESSGAEDASTLVLRISVPAGAEYEAIVTEMAAKVAAYLGDTDPDGAAAEALEPWSRRSSLRARQTMTPPSSFARLPRRC